MMQWLSVVYIVQKWVYMYTYMFIYIYTHEKICIQLYISILLYICLESICIYVYLCIYVFFSYIYIYNIDIFPRLSSVQNWFHEENSNKKHLLKLPSVCSSTKVYLEECDWHAARGPAISVQTHKTRSHLWHLQQKRDLDIQTCQRKPNENKKRQNCG